MWQSGTAIIHQWIWFFFYYYFVGAVASSFRIFKIIDKKRCILIYQSICVYSIFGRHRGRSFFFKGSENMRDHWGFSVNCEIENENMHVQKSDAVFFYKKEKGKNLVGLCITWNLYPCQWILLQRRNYFRFSLWTNGGPNKKYLNFKKLNDHFLLSSHKITYHTWAGQRHHIILFTVSSLFLSNLCHSSDKKKYTTLCTIFIALLLVPILIICPQVANPLEINEVWAWLRFRGRRNIFTMFSVEIDRPIHLYTYTLDRRLLINQNLNNLCQTVTLKKKRNRRRKKKTWNQALVFIFHVA